MDYPEQKTEKSIQSVARAIGIMQYIANHGNSVSLTAISKGMDLSKSTVYGLISTLEQAGYVFQDQTTGLYSLGLKLFELGQVVYASMDLRSIAMPFLYQIGKKHEETVHLAILSTGEVVYIEKVDSPHSIRIASNIGGRNPAHCTGVGKVLLAGLGEKELERVVAQKGLRRFTENTITDLSELKRQLELIRLRGYAVDDEEIEVGLRCVAAPIKNHRGETIAAISISGPTGRMADIRFDELTGDIMDVANQISLRFGYHRTFG
jgi:DNA-binding IclR family transcriptional regulator